MLEGARRIPWALLGKNLLSEIDAPGLFEPSGLQLLPCPFPSSLGQLNLQEVVTSSGVLGAALGLWTSPEGFIEGLAGTVLSVHSNLTHVCPQPPGSVRRTSSPARTATASGVYGTVMVTMTVVTTVTNSVVSGALEVGRDPQQACPWEETAAQVYAT